MSRRENTGESQEVNRRAVWAAALVIAAGGAVVGVDFLHAAGRTPSPTVTDADTLPRPAGGGNGGGGKH